MSAKKYDAGVKTYRETYWNPDYTPKDTDLLACFKVTPQEGVPRKFLKPAMDAMRQLCRDRFEQFGTAGNAGKINVLTLADMAKRYASGALDPKFA